MKSTIMAILVFASVAQASDLDVLRSYKTTAENLFNVFEQAQDSVDVKLANSLIDSLVIQGTQTMSLLGSKKQECAEQFKVFLSELDVIPTLSLNDVHKRYHDGTGLPAAPKFCYFGRSHIVHPIMTKMVLAEGWNAEIKEEVLHQTEEVIEHVERIEKLIK